MMKRRKSNLATNQKCQGYQPKMSIIPSQSEIECCFSLAISFKYKQTWAFITGKFFTDGMWWRSGLQMHLWKKLIDNHLQNNICRPLEKCEGLQNAYL